MNKAVNINKEAALFFPTDLINNTIAFMQSEWLDCAKENEVMTNVMKGKFACDFSVLFLLCVQTRGGHR